MLSEAKAHAVLPAQDIERAKSWYADKLGLKPSQETPAGLFYDMDGGTQFLLYPSAGKAPGDYTQIGLVVADLVSEVEDLRADGVEFIDYDMPGLKTVHGVVEWPGGKGAWFKDSEGNLLGLIQFD